MPECRVWQGIGAVSVLAATTEGSPDAARDCDLTVIGNVANDATIVNRGIARRIWLIDGRTTDLRPRINTVSARPSPIGPGSFLSIERLAASSPSPILSSR